MRFNADAATKKLLELRDTVEDLQDSIEDGWKHGRIIAWLLVITGTSLALWSTYHPQSPGVSIGLLALVAGVVSLRPQNTYFGENGMDSPAYHIHHFRGESN